MASVTQLHLYPLKSAAGLSTEQAYVTLEGLLGDRRFMLAKPDGGFISARTHPRLQSIKVQPVAGGLDLQYQQRQLRVRHAEFSAQPVSATVWDDSFVALVLIRTTMLGLVNS